ncbi:MAG: hypothetical protein HQL70_07705 [Magnetococcales bacterium]|nr:hypothetical protein [Magnetococcales bacterium]
MSTIVSNLTSPALFPGGDAARNTPSAGVTDLANNTQSTSNISALISAEDVVNIQNTSTTPRSTPQDMAQELAKLSRESRDVSGSFEPSGGMDIPRIVDLIA